MGPAHNGRTADGKLLAADYECGKCGDAGCDCPGWYPGLSDMAMTAATLAARAERNQLADVPFALTPPIGTRGSVQGDLF